ARCSATPASRLVVTGEVAPPNEPNVHHVEVVRFHDVDVDLTSRRTGVRADAFSIREAKHGERKRCIPDAGQSATLLQKASEQPRRGVGLLVKTSGQEQA